MVRENNESNILSSLAQAQQHDAGPPTSPPRTPLLYGQRDTEDDAEDAEVSDNDDEEEEDDDEEPLLKYTPLTKSQGPLYRNGDSVSTFLVAGDKMIVGTHNGFVHIFSLPSFQLVKYNKAHSASVTTISISPFPPPLPTGKSKRVPEQQDGPPASPKGKAENGKANPRTSTTVSNTPSNQIYIATSSIDGYVVVQSLIDSRDVLRRNFGRPVQTVALSPNFKTDRTYLSGGMAGNLILTVGGTVGKTSTSTTVGGAAAATQGWLGSMGLSADEGKDTILHAGEGRINTIRWSMSGKYVVWVNEQGIKVMRSHLHLETSESELAWKRIGHVDRPDRAPWSEMAGVWKARAEWVDEAGLETVASVAEELSDQRNHDSSSAVHSLTAAGKKRERLLIGWGSSIWILDIRPGEQGETKLSRNARLGKVEVATILRTDCIVSGVTLYTPNLLLVLAYVMPDEEEPSNIKAPPGSPSGGRRRRQNALPPEMRIIDIRTKEEVALADTLNVSRHESLSAIDYNLAALPVIRSETKVSGSRGALEMMGELGSNLYGGIWDVAMYPKTLLSSGASIRSADRDSDKGSSRMSLGGTPRPRLEPQTIHSSLLTRGIKIFVQSPYDCVLATKPTIADHLDWLKSQARYEEAYKLLESHPQAAGVLAEVESPSTPSTPTKGTPSLQDFFADDTSQKTGPTAQSFYSHTEKEKRGIGDLWVSQLVKAGDWDQAGRVCGKVVDTSSSWERWFWEFAEAGKYIEITAFIPSSRLRNQPPLSSTVYEAIFGHYIHADPVRFAEALNTYSADLFDVGSVITALESRLRAGDVNENSIEDGQRGRHWRILSDGLAKLYLAGGRYRDALRVYIKLQDAEAALSLIKTHHLAEAISNDIRSLIFLRVSREQLKTGSTEELDEASTDITQLLVTEAYQGIIPTTKVVSQLSSDKAMRPFLFFYLRTLWNGFDPSTSEMIAPESHDESSAMLTTAIPSPKVSVPSAANRAAHQLFESRELVNDVADSALPLFATYSRAIFASFLRMSQSYTLSLASELCEEHDYVPELVFLLAKEGRARRALRVILDRLGDIAQAIAFAREQADADLWEDLISSSLNKPDYVKVLLEEAGISSGGHGALNPIALVKRIPQGLEIEGLKEALGKMLREFELRESISEGVAKVCRGEVQESMRALRRGQKMGIKFDVVPLSNQGKDRARKLPARGKKRRPPPSELHSGRCAGCGGMFSEDDTRTLISFPCSHIFHLPCLILYESIPPAEEEKGQEGEEDASDSRPGTARSRASKAAAERLASEKEGENKEGDRVNKDSEDNDDDDEGQRVDPDEEDLGLPEPDEDDPDDRGVGAKVHYAKLIRGRVSGGCPLTLHVAA